VDRPGDMQRLRAAIGATISSTSFFGSIPVYEWYSWLADDEDRDKRPECFSTPGVYAQMNDGTYQKVGP
jgi:hypothetical protein